MVIKVIAFLIPNKFFTNFKNFFNKTKSITVMILLIYKKFLYRIKTLFKNFSKFAKILSYLSKISLSSKEK